MDNNLKKTIEDTIVKLDNVIKDLKEKISSEDNLFKRVKEGDNYYAVEISNSSGVVSRSENFNEKSNFDFENDNYFLSKKLAISAADKARFVLKLERYHEMFCPDFNPDWSNIYETKYYIYFNNESKYFEVSWTAGLNSVFQGTYFPSREIATKVCELINKEMYEDMKNYWGSYNNFNSEFIV